MPFIELHVNSNLRHNPPHLHEFISKSVDRRGDWNNDKGFLKTATATLTLALYC